MEEILYHCSPTAGLTALEPQETKYFGKPRQVCLTKLRPMALLYGIKNFEYTYGFNPEMRLSYEEYFPNALVELYRGKCASLYRCVQKPDMTSTAIPYELVSAVPVRVKEEILIPDILEALLEEEQRGNLRIIRYDQQTEKMRDWVRRTERDVILENHLLRQSSPFARYMREKYPESWALAENSKGEI